MLDRPQTCQNYPTAAHCPHHLKRPKLVRTPFNIVKLQQPTTQLNFQQTLDDTLSTNGPLHGTASEKWNKLRDIISETAMATLGPTKRIHQDWFDENNTASDDLLARQK